MSGQFFVVVTEDATGKEVKRTGPMPERKAETCLMGMLRQMNHYAYSASMIPADCSNVADVGGTS